MGTSVRQQICAHCGHPLRVRVTLNISTGRGDARCANCNAVAPGYAVVACGDTVALRRLFGAAETPPAATITARPGGPRGAA